MVLDKLAFPLATGAPLPSTAEEIDVSGGSLSIGTPAPVRSTLWGLPGALSGMLRKAERLPRAVGVKVTLMLQLLPGATLAPEQVSAALLKSPGAVPPSDTLPMVTGNDPVLVTAALWDELVVPTF